MHRRTLLQLLAGAAGLCAVPAFGFDTPTGSPVAIVKDRPERILLQDDEEGCREVFSAMLSSAHYECRAVEWPKGILEVLRSDKDFDLVFCGLYESLEDKLIEQLSAAYPTIPVVVASASFDIPSYLTALQKGAYDYLFKPFEREQLLVVVRRALEYRRLKLENQAYRQRLESNNIVARSRTADE
jgi:DNA-binding NtrC family response regulator